YGRSFIDVKSQVYRQSISLNNFQQSWCRPAVAPEHWKQDIVSRVLESHRASTMGAGVRLKNWLSERILLIANPLLLANFVTNSDIPGASFLLFALTVAGLLNLWIGSSTGSDVSVSAFKWTRRLKWAALALLFSCVMLNPSVAMRLSADGILEKSTILTLRLAQVAVALVGSVLFLVRNNLIAALIKRLSSTSRDLQKTKLLAINLLSPWLVMLCVADGERLGRFWWLWPVQIIVL